MRQFLLGMMFVAAAVAPVSADNTWELEADDTTYSYVCHGDKLVVRGNGNQLDVTGECASLVVRGSNNRISVEAIGSVDVAGDNNDVVYTSGADGKSKPKIKKKGASNTVRKRS